MTVFFAPDPVFDDSNCQGLSEVEREWFFAKSGGVYKKAKAICNGTEEDHDVCPAKDACLQRVLKFEPLGSKAGGPRQERFGVWGGLSARERERMFKEDADDDDGLFDEAV